MEKIKIAGSEQVYEITEIRPMSEAVMRIAFAADVPTKWGDIELYTDGDVLATTLAGYSTVYRDEGKVVYLSNDGSVYVPQEDPDGPLPPEPYEPTLEELRAAKLSEISTACESVIYAGVDVTLADGSAEHYSLTVEDQLNLFGKQSQLAAGAAQLEYHADGHPCRFYSAADMQAIIQTAMRHVSYHTTYCNALNMWVKGVETADELQEIAYGADVPEEYQSEVLKAYLAEIAALAGGEAGADPA